MWERQPASERAVRRRLAWSLVAALALHVLLAFFFGRELANKLTPHSAPLSVELIERPSTTPRPVPSPASPPQRESHHAPRASGGPPPVGAPTPLSKGGGNGGVAPEAHARAPEPGGFTVPPVTRPSAPEPGGITVPPPPSTHPEDVRLYDEHALGEVVDRWKKEHGGEGTGTGAGQGEGTGAGDSNSPEAEKARVSGRIGNDLANAQAKDRVASGLVDPYFHQIGGDLRDSWLPTPSSIGGRDGDSLGDELHNLGQSWSAAGRQYAKTGSPYAEGEKPAGLDNAHAFARPINGTSGFDGADFAARWNSGEFAFSGGIVVVQLVQDSKGKPTEVRVLKSSGFKEFDQSAIAAVKRTAASKAAPKHGLGLGGERIESVWKMEARMVANTCSFMPDPTGGVGVTGGAGFFPTSIQCGGTFDPSLKKAEFDRPGKTKIITRVELIAIYGGETGPTVKVQ